MSVSMIWLGVALYLVISVLVAFASREGKSRDMSGYFLGSRSMSGVVSSLSYSATTYSAFMMIGLVGLTYAGGIGALGFEIMYFAGVSLAAIFGPKFWRVGKRYGFITPTEMLGHRYQSKPVAMISAIASCLFLIPYSAVQLSGIGLLLSGMTDGAITFSVGIMLATAIAVLFSYIAGIRSVMWTDSLQALLMIIASTAVVFIVVYQLGGFSEMFANLSENHPESLTVPGSGFFSFTTFLALSIPWFFFSLSSPQLSQRLFIPGSLRAMRQMILGFMVFGLLFTVVAVLLGLSSLAAFPDLASADLATPTLLSSDMIPPLLGVILMVGVMAAAVSTIDSIMLTLSSMFARDVYGVINKEASERSQLRIGKFVIPVIAGMALAFAQLQLDLIAVLSVASSAGLIVLVPSIIGAFYWRGGTAAGSIASILVAGVAVIAAQATGFRIFGLPPGIWGIFLATGVFVGVSLVTRAPEQRAKEFVAIALNRGDGAPDATGAPDERPIQGGAGAIG